VVLVGNDLYVADTDAIPALFLHLRGNHHFSRRQAHRSAGRTDRPSLDKSLAASPDGSKLFVGVGSNSNITENGMAAEAGRAAIWEVDRRTGFKRMYASGLRNPTGVAFEPQTGKLWAIVNERDEIGPNLVPDYLTAVR